MARREGSPGYCTPSVDRLECRFLLTKLHSGGSVSRPAPIPAAEVSRLAAAGRPTIGIVHSATSASHPGTSSNDEGDGDGEAGSGADSRGLYVGLRSSTSDPNLLLLTGPNQAAGAPMEAGPAHLATQITAGDMVPQLAPAKGPTSTLPSSPGDEFGWGTGPGLDPSRPMSLHRITAGSLGRIGVVLPADRDGSPTSTPRRSDLLSDNFLPFDRGSLEDAFDRLFDRLDGLDGDGPDPGDPTRAIPDSLVLAAAAGVLELGRRYWRRGPEEGEARAAGVGEAEAEADGDDGDAGLPDRPEGWPTRYL